MQSGQFYFENSLLTVIENNIKLIRNTLDLNNQRIVSSLGENLDLLSFRRAIARILGIFKKVFKSD